MDWYNSIIVLLDQTFPLLGYANAFSLVGTLIVLALSSMMSEPVREPIHWLAAMGAIPTAITLVIAMIALAVIVVVAVINIVTWIVILIFGITLFFGFFASAGSG